MSKFAQNLRYLRRENSITQSELGKRLSFGASTISSYETAMHEPSYDVLIKLCDFFSVSVDYMLGRDETSIYSIKEVQLLEKYRRLKDSDKQLIIALLESLAKR